MENAEIAVVMGSISDWEEMKFSCETLDLLDIKYDKMVLSAHRTPIKMLEFAGLAKQNGYKIIIAGAGGAAHLPGMIASNTTLPVVGVPIKSKTLNGVDSLLSIVQMPFGVPVATMAIGSSGAKNAALISARILALNDDKIAKNLDNFIQKQQLDSIKSSEKLYE